KNVVIFGETGVGKSSLINLLAGENVSETSSSAVGCTLNYKRYPLKLGDQRFVIWDTAGLDEGSQGTVPAEKAEEYLRQLLRDLARASGIDLLIYCVRGTRVRSALLTNYHLFYSAICRKKVPIAIAITGLENQEGNMDSWWLKNERQFSALQMRFDNYACVTTLQPLIENPTLEERRRISKAALVKLITNTCRAEHWMPSERGWVDTAFSDVRAILSPKEGNTVHVANVIMCDVS
ncbi:P-loop containing nucleoside triphosphate hydrolase protein, partial [Boletus edulis]